MNTPMLCNIAIIGAGVSGSVLARQLNEFANVVVFEKSRGVSGRLATRYSDEYAFDHGAPFFSARSKPFKKFLQYWIETGVISEWTAKATTFNQGKKPYNRQWFEPHYVANGKMNNWCKALLHGTNVLTGTEVDSLNKQAEKWTITDTLGTDHTNFDLVISTAPSQQTRRFFPAEFKHTAALARVKMTPSYSLMLGLNNIPSPYWDIAKCQQAPVKWVAIDSSKPGHNQKALSLTIHSQTDWAQRHIETEPHTVSEQLLTALNQILPFDRNAINYQSLHRWRYASVATQRPDSSQKNKVVAPPSHYWDEPLGLAAAGDWCLYGDVDSAFTSAAELAEKIKHRLAKDAT